MRMNNQKTSLNPLYTPKRSYSVYGGAWTVLILGDIEGGWNSNGTGLHCTATKVKVTSGKHSRSTGRNLLSSMIMLGHMLQEVWRLNWRDMDGTYYPIPLIVPTWPPLITTSSSTSVTSLEDRTSRIVRMSNLHWRDSSAHRLRSSTGLVSMLCQVVGRKQSMLMAITSNPFVVSFLRNMIKCKCQNFLITYATT